VVAAEPARLDLRFVNYKFSNPQLDGAKASESKQVPVLCMAQYTTSHKFVSLDLERGDLVGRKRNVSLVPAAFSVPALLATFLSLPSTRPEFFEDS
jgi:hypothetical protein